MKKYSIVRIIIFLLALGSGLIYGYFVNGGFEEINFWRAGEWGFSLGLFLLLVSQYRIRISENKIFNIFHLISILLLLFLIMHLFSGPSINEFGLSLFYYSIFVVVLVGSKMRTIPKNCTLVIGENVFRHPILPLRFFIKGFDVTWWKHDFTLENEITLIKDEIEKEFVVKTKFLFAGKDACFLKIVKQEHIICNTQKVYKSFLNECKGMNYNDFMIKKMDNNSCDGFLVMQTDVKIYEMD